MPCVYNMHASLALMRHHHHSRLTNHCTSGIPQIRSLTGTAKHRSPREGSAWPVSTPRLNALDGYSHTAESEPGTADPVSQK